MSRTISHILCLLLPVVAACSTEEMDSSIPNSKVYLKTTLDDYTRLHTAGAFRTYEPGQGIYATNTALGYAGIAIFRDFDGKIHACDLACPVEHDRNVKIALTSSLMATCATCGSQFNLQWGTCAPVAGPARQPLRTYHCTDSGSYILASN